ncbi:bifunctional 23S rRNA (guanine(2069)-N(7))-methyltransferase RlmK/23S rRNA (guanine(2445)-N(2))-methyltransferase RlmL [Saccharospirillum salsuginis]|uniref:Ribosomal RNA large subunit methyltransferase K/L n=1 Tax=Saccharospirillum salsuginis TaxID=418750 RepID=A0A918N8P4_9GAMM|nr:bifunctional 23S rRNA (guanine(2069)-N(7))-methyltransferase RlmK/23S rRNA (guanine(2445)-N(2))-methyltransferase RlmL [Saccharospirillum salsuginis]GGX51575.1 ribosomal RNA large subunit methyltransferase K/L [Saccharospirillum salsuginis]
MSSNLHTETDLDVWVTCPNGFHGLLKREIADLTGQTPADWSQGVSVRGELDIAYRLCLWSRLANRVYLGLGQSSEVSVDGLRELVESVAWDAHLRPSGTLRVDFHGRMDGIDDARYGGQKVKDFIVDQFRDRHGVRPNVDRDNPDVTVYVQVRRKRIDLGIDLSGDSLHRRGYRQATGPAPLKENLAAAVLMAADWPERVRDGQAFIDPLCGSGTLVVEAAMIAADIAPGLLRKRFGFEQWLGHDRSLWNDLVSEARQRRQTGEASMPPVLGYDADGGVVARANETLERLGLYRQARCYHKPLDQWTRPTHLTLKPGLVVSNPPYGERLGNKPELLALYRRIGDLFRNELSDWTLGLLTSDAVLARETGLRAGEKHRFFNGRIETHLYVFTPGERAAEPSPAQTEQDEALRNRLRKNLKQRRKWLKKQDIEAYRLYDADLPEFAIAVDVYGDALHVQEYAPPKDIPEDKARQRLLHAMAVLAEVTGIPVERIELKQRQRQKGRQQYERQSESGEFFTIREEGVRLRVNLKDYLDTGVFLDHRPTRTWIQKQAGGRSVLNLFCYTGAATAHAYVGQAASTTSVDLSRTYLNWARENLRLNGGKPDHQHRFIQADCLKWLRENTERFDLIFMDPPTFSNSSRMTDTLDIQRDHVELIEQAMRSLNPDGVLVFSNNFRKFKLDESLIERYQVKDVTHLSVPEDFKRKRPHQCWHLRHR